IVALIIFAPRGIVGYLGGFVDKRKRRRRIDETRRSEAASGPFGRPGDQESKTTDSGVDADTSTGEAKRHCLKDETWAHPPADPVPHQTSDPPWNTEKSQRRY